ncbi:hypothetical protein Sjap_009783 [Stephania japonica]|uniref:Uncharacterized protein n=1 Tax=Stephania japonica TaxID=461633 RepID=A0AAP0P6J0_9MAGN
MEGLAAGLDEEDVVGGAVGGDGRVSTGHVVEEVEGVLEGGEVGEGVEEGVVVAEVEGEGDELERYESNTRLAWERVGELKIGGFGWIFLGEDRSFFMAGLLTWEGAVGFWLFRDVSGRVADRNAGGIFPILLLCVSMRNRTV